MPRTTGRGGEAQPRSGSDEGVVCSDPDATSVAVYHFGATALANNGPRGLHFCDLEGGWGVGVGSSA